MADGGGGPDVEVRFARDGPATAVDLVAAWPGDGEGPLVVDGAAVADDTPLASGGLAHGAVVSVGSTPPGQGPALHVVAGPLTPRSARLDGPLLIGRGAACGLRLPHPSVAPAHVLVEPAPGGWTVSSITPSASLDGEPLSRPVPLRPGAVLAVGAVDLQLDPSPPPARVSPPSAPVHRAVATPDRVPAPPPPPPEPSPPAPPPAPPGALTLVLPVAVGAVLAVTVHPAAGLVTAATPLLAVGSHLDARRRHRRDRRREDARQADALERHQRDVGDHRAVAAATERAGYPTAVEALTRAFSGRGLWPVRAEDGDVVRLAVGWSDDRIRGPVTIGMDQGHRLGIAGPRPWVEAVARALIVQATARSGPTAWSVSLPDEPSWTFARWLPHTGSRGRPLTVDADEPGAGFEMAEHRAQLTDRCRAVLTWSPDGARLWETGGDAAGLAVRPLVASVEIAERYGRASARWTDPEPAAAGLPDQIGLAALLAAGNGGGDDGRASLAAPLGVGADGIVTVDLVADGPHALVAGTTGAGKSELLRTWVTALASLHAPTAVAFVLVDYKGGSAFDACARLPHVTGVVTDLEAGLGERLLVGLRAELRERELALRRAGVGDLRDLVGGPPRLVVVVDEFATLAAELPDLLGALVDVARRGRSLGVHLVLATQRPAGAVNDDIRANTALRICLRTLDGADSQDVLGGPEAAQLAADRPGRAWLRTGQGLALTQVASTSAPEPTADQPPVLVRRVGEAWPAGDRAAPRSLDRLVDEASAVWGGHQRPTPAWRPPLPERLELGAEPDVDRGVVLLGRCDRPAARDQPPLVWSPGQGHLVVLGGRGSGRTTAARTCVLELARRRPADALHVHIVTRSGDLADLAELPHVGAVVAAHDRETVRRLLGRVGGGPLRPGRLTVLVVDGYEALAAAVDDLDALRLLDDVDRLARDGVDRGIALVLTSSRPGLLPPSLLAAADRLVVLGLDDPADYGILGLRAPVGTGPPGRGRSGLGDEVQIGVPGTSVTEIVAAHGPVPPGTGPPPVGPLPVRLARRELVDDGPGVAFGCRDRDLATVRVALAGGTPFVIAGPPRSGRTVALAQVLLAPDRPVITFHDGDDADRFRAEVRAWLAQPTPRLFAIDDGEELADPDGVLRALAARRHPDAQLVVSVRADAWRSAYGSWLAELRPAGHGLALGADPVHDAESWTVPLPPLDPNPPPGRGVLISATGADVIQVAVDLD